MLALLLLAALSAVGAALIHPKKPQWNRSSLAEGEVDLKTANEWAKKVLWVDARPRDQFDAGHIPGALLLNSFEWEPLLDPFLDEWNRDRIVVVYCGSADCELSRQVAEKLRKEVQISKVYVLKGGWQAWRESQK
jgi:rhodanese-related sulfurtransferase